MNEEIKKKMQEFYDTIIDIEKTYYSICKGCNCDECPMSGEFKGYKLCDILDEIMP